MRAPAVVVVAALCGSCAAAPGSDVDRKSEEPLLAIHLTQDEQRSRMVLREFEGRRIHLEEQPVISDPDIMRVSADLYDGGVILDVELRPDAAERMRRVTGYNIGREMAIVFDSEIVGVPVIQSEIGGRGQVPIPATSSEEAQRFLKLIRARWPD